MICKVLKKSKKTLPSKNCFALLFHIMKEGFGEPLKKISACFFCERLKPCLFCNTLMNDSDKSQNN